MKYARIPSATFRANSSAFALYLATSFLFADSNGKPFRPDSYYQRWKRLIDRHGLPSIHFHYLRHTSATLLLNSGLDIKVIQERLRHKSFNTTADIYSHVLKEKQQEAANTFKNPFT
ncbi:tyrosine-type recombinase/integrase [Listeria seeligeri]|uniref:tyrosine-type recombinase/integrase n=1 Tax=Listeria seeligeri TaxID=1640 RepID=UPI00162A09EE|nr:tyrosine-type recombinase/integrase [Listeria seeligeri]MBC1789546.1 tyrosine-type recombinase/integrase [Listeria seeligeri]MBC1846127.1 tyrosine-type recombinase/integrase [Listeria seeligeri]